MCSLKACFFIFFVFWRFYFQSNSFNSQSHLWSKIFLRDKTCRDLGAFNGHQNKGLFKDTSLHMKIILILMALTVQLPKHKLSSYPSYSYHFDFSLTNRDLFNSQRRVLKLNSILNVHSQVLWPVTNMF